MARIWYLSPQAQKLRDQRPIHWCIDKLWISPRDFRSTAPPAELKAESVWVEVTEPDASQAPGYKAGYHSSYLSPQEVEQRLKQL